MTKSLFIVAAMVLPLTFSGQNFKNRVVVGEDSARQTIRTVTDSTYKLSTDTLISDKDMAISIAEVLLFKRYGKALISGERPYECYLIDGFWFLRGTLPKSYTGDVFEIIMSARDGRVIKMTHASK